jgi:hypothetical protein
MASLGFFTIGCWFLLLSHGTLLTFFLMDFESSEVSMTNVLFPRPKRGRVVGYFALILAFLCFAFAVFFIFFGLPQSGKVISDGRALQGILLFVVFPYVPYILYIAKHFARVNGRLVFLIPK